MEDFGWYENLCEECGNDANTCSCPSCKKCGIVGVPLVFDECMECRRKEWPIAAVGMEVTVGNPWWRKGVPTRCVISEVYSTYSGVMVKPLEGHPHARSISCEDAGVQWPGKQSK